MVKFCKTILIYSCILSSFGYAQNIKPASANQNSAPTSKNILMDPNFSKGFEVYMVEDGVPGLDLEVKKTILFDKKQKEKPDWQMAQWNNYNNKMEEGSYSFGNGLHRYRTKGGNEFAINPDQGLVTLTLNTASEYGKNAVSPDNPRKDGQKWPHLLISQTLEEASVPLARAKSVVMGLTYTINAVKDNHEQGTFNKNYHAAQFQWFISVNNQNKDSKGYGDYMWFGFSFYDVRNEFNPFYANADFNTTGKFIYMPGMKEVLGSQNATKVGEAKTVEIETLKDLKKAFQLAKERGFLKDSNWEDLYIGHTNIGWEVPGSFDVSSTMKNIHIAIE